MEKMDLLGELTKAQSRGPERNKRRDEGEEEDEGEGMELSLGLSMNGRFGVDPEKTKKLKRSSSVASVAFAGETLGAAAMGARGMGFEVHAPLLRTRSLPVETEEEWRRRKEQQSMRRMEARKKRMEKLKNLNLRVTRDKGECSRDANGGKSELHGAANGDSNGPRFHRSENGEVLEPSSQGTIGPLRSGSSGSCDLIEGTNQTADLSPSIKPSPNSDEPTSQDPEREPKGSNMPYVTTKETGPNGRRVEGFLYGYKRGESVRIMCVCHGAFLTPKEFVEHGGVRVDVDHPLKHIVVNPFPLL